MSKPRTAFQYSRHASAKAIHQSLAGLVLAMARILLVPALMLLAATTSAHARRCSADTECYDYGRAQSICNGNTLVIKKAICAGSCRVVEVSRMPCPGPCVGGRCVGGPTRSGPLPPPLGGGRPVGVCARLCKCDGKRLTYGLGFADREKDCRRRHVDCVYGCSCDPEPRCLKKNEK
ncbi:MAG: hypothetical protein ACK5JT_18920 [Hyphomicrobiaceae bacterium]